MAEEVGGGGGAQRRRLGRDSGGGCACAVHDVGRQALGKESSLQLLNLLLCLQELLHLQLQGHGRWCGAFGLVDGGLVTVVAGVAVVVAPVCGLRSAVLGGGMIEATGECMRVGCAGAGVGREGWMRLGSRAGLE